MKPEFDYPAAFVRNLGWVTRQEQDVLRGKRVAIAGLGGVGGSHLLTLARLGVGGFHIADFDRFELVNFNRQAGATMRQLGRPKVDVLSEMALDVNPCLDLRRFPEGVKAGNVAEFLAGTDLYLDGLDYFALDARRLVFRVCAERRIPAVTVAPIGMGAALMVFVPGRMTFEEYFQLEGQAEEEQLLRIAVGLAPWAIQRNYLVDPSGLDLAARRAPSTPMGADLCAGVAGTEVLKILLGRGPIRPAPHAFQFDAYSQRLVHTWRPGGNRNLLNRIALSMARRKFLRGGRRGGESRKK